MVMSVGTTRKVEREMVEAHGWGSTAERKVHEAATIPGRNPADVNDENRAQEVSEKTAGS